MECPLDSTMKNITFTNTMFMEYSQTWTGLIRSTINVQIFSYFFFITKIKTVKEREGKGPGAHFLKRTSAEKQFQLQSILKDAL